MQLMNVIYLLPLVQVDLIQTPAENGSYNNISLFIEPTTSEFECLNAIIRKTFKYSERSLIILTTIETEENTEYLQKMLIRYLNEEGKASLELLGKPPHPEFESSTICYLESNVSDVETCRHNFVLKKSADFYVIIASDFETLQGSLYSAYNSSTFNPFAEFLLYWRYSGEVPSSDLVQLLWKYQMLKVVLVQDDVRNGSKTIFVLQLKLSGPGNCADKSKFLLAGPCQNPGSITRLQALIRNRIPKTFKNCTIDTIAMPYEPFVINQDEGIEIELLKEMGKHINATFDVTVTAEAEDWGDKVNGSWNGNLAEIINTLKVGIGNVGPEADRLEDFDFSYSYKSPDLVWVVPIAQNVEKWRVLTMIFTKELWSVIFAVFMVLSGLFVLLSRSCKDYSYLRSIPGGFLASLQVLLGSSVHNPPNSTLVRLVFIGGVLFSLIVTCVYSSYLINVLTNVVKEHQIQNEKEILESGLLIGGLEEYLERFQKSDEDECLDEICKRYLYFQNENNTAIFWLERVEARKACTPLPRLFVQYYMLKRFEVNTEKTESITETVRRVKLFIIDKPINFYSLGIVMNKGNPFKKSFDKFIKKFVEAGLMFKLSMEFSDKFRKLEYFVMNADQGPERLSVYHVQGSFAIIGIGDLIAILIFLLEKLRLSKLGSSSRKNKLRPTHRDPRNKNLYCDQKYGNMYGRNYPNYSKRIN